MNSIKARKKPVVVDAIQYKHDNLVDTCMFITCMKTIIPSEGKIIIPTLEGDMIATERDWIIKGVNGEFYPCKDEIFKKTYDIIGE